MIYYIFKLICIIVLTIPFYLLLRKPWKYKEKREWILGGFWIFTIGLLTLALEGNYGSPKDMLYSGLSRIKTGEKINFVPFQTISVFFKNFEWNTFLINIVGNIVMFLPWGFGLPLLWKKNQKPVKIVFFSFLITAFIEICQLFIGRSVDIDDFILNFIGGCFGGGFYFILKRKFPMLSKFAK